MPFAEASPSRPSGGERHGQGAEAEDQYGEACAEHRPVEGDARGRIDLAGWPDGRQGRKRHADADREQRPDGQLHREARVSRPSQRQWVGADDVFAHLEVDPVLGACDLAVAGVGAGPAAGFLAVANLGVLLDAKAHPSGGSDGLDGLGRRRLHSDDGLQPASVRRQLLVQLVKRSDPCGDAVAAGVGVAFDLV